VTSEGGSAQQAIDWVLQNGDSNTRTVVPFPIDQDPDGIYNYDVYSTEFRTYELNLGWRYDSRNRAIFATSGMRHRFNVGYTLPGSDVEFWTASYDYLQFVPLWAGFTLMFNLEAAYGKAMGDTTALPPYRQHYVGGPDSVRGYKESRLGPKDDFGRPYGGNIKTVAQTELLLPMPEKWRNSARFSLFFDIGNVFSDQNIDFYGPERLNEAGEVVRDPADYSFSYDELKQSAGVAVQWLAPLGVFRFSYSIPLNKKSQSLSSYGDETEGFQFSIGQAF
jgi:outer membrane protein insertion porin family